MQSPIVSATRVDYSKEREQGKNLVEAALAEGVGTFVHTATSGVGDHRHVEGWAEGRWKSHEDCWENKLATCELVRNAGFDHWTIILPATFMDHPMLDPAGFADGRRVVQSGTVEEAVAAGLHPGVAQGMTYMNVAPVLARPEIARSYGLSPMSFETWARQQRRMA